MYVFIDILLLISYQTPENKFVYEKELFGIKSEIKFLAYTGKLSKNNLVRKI